jgi:seryl-tRNA synthetase
MLDIKWIRENEDVLQQVADGKGIAISIRDLVNLDKDRRSLLQEMEQLRQQRNRLARDIRATAQQGCSEAVERLKRTAKDINARLALTEAQLVQTKEPFKQLMACVPNVVSPDTPKGRSDADNVEVRRAGEAPAFDFEPQDHVALGTLHGMIDIPRGVKTAGARNYYLKGSGVLLHRAVQQLALDLLIGRGFTPIEVPLLVRSEALIRTGFFPFGENQTFRIAGEDKWLVGTSEAPLVSYYSNEIVDVSEPVRLAADGGLYRRYVAKDV